jgi:hypothetical protein
MTKDKYKYIENLFRNYKKNKSRIKILNLGMVTDDDFTISGVDYSKDKIQTSNMSDLSDTVIKREKELEKLIYEVSVTEALLESLNTKDRYIIEAFYIENIRMNKIALKLNYYETKTIWINKDRIINSLIDLVE